MRVTNRMLGEGFLINLRKNLRNMQRIQNQLSTGKEVYRPSDDPFKVARAMTLETAIGRNVQFERNMEDSLGWVENNDSVLGAAGDVLQRIRELLVSGANSSQGRTEHKAIEEEVRQLVTSLAEIGNSNYDGRYVLGGQKTTTPPFRIDDGTGMLTYDGDTGSLNRELLPGVNMAINVNGAQMLGVPGAGDHTDMAYTLNEILGTLVDLSSGSAADPGASTGRLGGELLKELDVHIENVLNLRTGNGARQKRLETLLERNGDETLGMRELLSKTEDIDFAEKIMQSAMMQHVYNASLAAGSKILQQTLLDYL